MKYNILFGGEAGQGPNILTHLLAEVLVEQGFYVFYARDYQSLIRGGHNFNVLTFSEKPVFSNDKELDLIIALDKNTVKIHGQNLKKEGLILEGKHPNMYFAGRLFKVLGMDFKLLDRKLKELEHKYKENIVEAKKGYDEAEAHLDLPTVNKSHRSVYPKEGQDPKLRSAGARQFYSGSQGIAKGAIASGIDIYYAYPMTPATPVLGELAAKQKDENILVLELENEIAVASAGVGSSITGAKTMVGTSGGGFDLMGETLSMAGIAGAPLVFYLAQRTGPGTGVATYNTQGDLNIARHSGHGEFERVVLAPGDSLESIELINQAFYLSQKFGVPSIIISDKHCAESFFTVDKKEKITKSGKWTKFGRYNSYEKNSEGSATEDPKTVVQNVQERMNNWKVLEKETEKFEGYKVYGKKNSNNCVVFWGSTKGAVLDAISGLDICAIQVLHISPFPLKVEKLLKGKNLILVENNSSGQLGDLIREKTGLEIKKKVLKYDGRPFLCDELRKELGRVLR